MTNTVHIVQMTVHCHLHLHLIIEISLIDLFSDSEYLLELLHKRNMNDCAHRLLSTTPNLSIESKFDQSEYASYTI